MKLNIVNQVLLCACFICAAAASNAAPLLPLKAPPAPFVKEAAAALKAETFKPEIKDGNIVSGNKKLQVNNDGTLLLFAGDDRNPVSFELQFKTDAGYGSIAMRERQRDSSAYDTNNRSFKFAADYPLNKTEPGHQEYFKVTRTVALLPDGLISVKAAWEVPDQDKAKFQNAYFFIIWPENNYGKKVVCAGKEYIVNNMEGEKQWWFMGTTQREEICFFPNEPQASFNLTPEKYGLLLTASRAVGGNKMQVNITPGANQGSISFLVDIRNAVSVQKPSEACGGIDFMAIDALEMPDYSSCRNLIQNPSFEQGLTCSRIRATWEAYYPGKDKWRDIFSIDKTNALFGKSCLKIQTPYMGSSAWKDQQKPEPSETFHVPSLILAPIPLDPGKYTLSFYAKCDRPGKQMVGLVGLWRPTAEWKRYQYTYEVTENTKQPVTMQIQGLSETYDGNIWIDGLQLEKGDKATEFTLRTAEGELLTSAPDNFLRRGDKIGAELKIMSKPEASGQVRVTAKDFFSQILFDENFKFKCDKEGIARIKLPFNGIFPCGIFVVKAEYQLDSGEKTRDFFRFSIMDFLENKHRLKNMFGYMYGDYGGMPDLPQRLNRYRQIGVGAVTCIRTWRQDCYDLYTAYGIDVITTSMATDLFYDGIPINNGYLFTLKTSDPRNNGGVRLRDYRYDDRNAKLTAAYLAKFKDAVAENARSAPWVKMWKLEGELRSGGRYGMKPDDFTKLMLAFCEGVKQGNPDAKIIIGGPCNMDPQGGIKELGENLDAWNWKFDYMAIHPYRAKPEDPDLDLDAQELFRMLKTHGYENTPVIWPECMQYGPYNIPQWGYESASWTPPRCWYAGALSYDMGWAEKISAAWRARSWLAALKYQDRIITFDSGGGNNFDMDARLTPFASQKIPNTLGNLLGNAYFKEDIRFAPYTRCYIFEDEQKRPVAAVWGHYRKLDAGTIPAFEAVANFGGEAPEVFDIMQTERAVTPDKDGNINFPVSSFPLFFRGKPGSLQAFIKAFKGANLLSAEDIAPVTVSGVVISPETMNIEVKSMAQAFEGTIAIAGASQPVHAPAAGTVVVPARLPEKLSPARIIAENIPVRLSETTSKKQFKIDCSFNGFICRKAPTDMVIDGQTNDWEAIPSVPLGNRYIWDKNTKSVSDSDFSGWFKVAWNEKGLYLCVKITDDKFVHMENVELYEKINPWHNRWNNDALQVYFDTRCDARNHEFRGYDMNDYDYGIFPNAAGTGATVYRYRSPDPQLTVGDKAPRDGTVADDIKAAFAKTADGYIYEVMFPAVRLLPVNLEKGCTAGFSLFVNDRDDLESKEPKSSLTLTPPGTACYNNPHLWPVMLLWE